MSIPEVVQSFPKEPKFFLPHLRRRRSLPSTTSVTTTGSTPSFSLPDHHLIHPSTSSLKSCLAQHQDSTVSKSVSFHTLTVREYSQIPDINPSVSSGTAVSLGWDFQAFDSIDIKKYEDMRSLRWVKSELSMPARVRQELLLQQFSMSEIQRAAKESAMARQQRQSTCSLQDLERAHLLFESVGRKWNRWVKRTSKQAEMEELWIKAQEKYRMEASISSKSSGCSDYDVGLDISRASTSIEKNR